MNEIKDEVLADALVEAGILKERFDDYYFPGKCFGSPMARDPEVAITDWRVAGKVLESWESRSYSYWLLSVSPLRLAKTLRDPRAIIEAWYQATEQEGEGC